MLVLSRFAGAARQLKAAILVNPYDVDGVADAIEAALNMPLAERTARWKECWAAIEDASALGWGRAFLASLLRAASAGGVAAEGGASLPVGRMRSSPDLRHAEAGRKGLQPI